MSNVKIMTDKVPLKPYRPCDLEIEAKKSNIRFIFRYWEKEDIEEYIEKDDYQSTVKEVSFYKWDDKNSTIVYYDREQNNWIEYKESASSEHSVLPQVNKRYREWLTNKILLGVKK